MSDDQSYGATDEERDAAMEVVLDAARSWHNELVTYIIDGVETDAERESYQKQADDLEAALDVIG